MRRLIRRIHFLVAVVGGLLLSIVTVSGSLSVFRPEIERMHAAEPGPAGVRADLDTVVPRLQEAYPEARIQRLVTPAAYGGGVFEWTVVDDRGTKEREDDEVWKAYTDPASGTLLGDNRGSALSGTIAWIARFHHNLWLGNTGGILVGASGFCLFIFIITGIWLWWPGLAKWRQGFALRWTKGWYLRHYDVHKLAGLVFVPLFTLTALTGTMFEFRWMRTFAHYALGGSAEELPLNLRPEPGTPSMPATEKPAAASQREAAPGPDQPHGERSVADAAIGWNEAALRAEAAVGGTLLSLSPPRPGREPIWNVVIDHPTNVGSNSGIVVRVNGAGTVTDVVDTRGMSLGGQVSNQLWGLHVGTWGGLTSRLLHVLSGFVPPLLLVTGFALWWLRHRRKKSGEPTPMAMPAMSPVP